jgi:hypothetical protein
LPLTVLHEPYAAFVQKSLHVDSFWSGLLGSCLHCKFCQSQYQCGPGAGTGVGVTGAHFATQTSCCIVQLTGLKVHSSHWYVALLQRA